MAPTFGPPTIGTQLTAPTGQTAPNQFDPHGLYFMGPVSPGVSILWGLFVQGTGSGGSEVWGSNEFGTKCIAAPTPSKNVVDLEANLASSKHPQTPHIFKSSVATGH